MKWFFSCLFSFAYLICRFIICQNDFLYYKFENLLLKLFTRSKKLTDLSNIDVDLSEIVYLNLNCYNRISLSVNSIMHHLNIKFSKGISLFLHVLYNERHLLVIINIYFQ